MAAISAVGAVYDVIQCLELPAFNETDRVDQLTVRETLRALAWHLNHVMLKRRVYRVFASAPELAERVGRSPRTIERVLRYLIRTELIKVAQPGLRAGRGRPSKAPTYWLPIDQWQERMRPPTQRRNGRDTGDVETAMVATPGSPEPGQGVDPAKLTRPGEPGRARARARR